MNELKIILLSAKNETIEQKFTENYLLSFENTINTILTEKYGDNIILGSYDYYKNDTKSKIEEIISNISNKWESIYDSLNNEIKENKSNINKW